MGTTKRINIKKNINLSQKSIIEKCRELFSVSPIKIILGLITVTIIIAISFISFRMKRIELAIQINKELKNKDELLEKNKYLKAQKAELLSPKRLRSISSDYSLQQPSEEQLIIIP